MEELKDLGGLVNKDLAFSKLPQNAVFDSENFRITTNDGNTMAARQNIKGNKAISGIPQLPCVKNLTFDTATLQALLIPGDSYTITLAVNGITAPGFTFIFSTFSNFLNDFSNFINTNPLATVFFGNFSITTYVGGQALFLVVPNCDTITIDFFGTTVPKAGVTPFPYKVYDEEFAIENLNGSSYNANQGFVGVPQWALNGDSFPVAGINTYNTYMGTGVSTQAGVLIDPTPTVLVWKSTSTGQATDVHWYGDPFYVSNIQTTAPSLFQYFTGGPYQIYFSFYIAKTTNAQVTLQILLDLGPNLDLAAVASYGLSTVVLPSIGYPLIVVDTSVYPNGTTDIDYLSIPYGFFWNVPGLTSWEDLLVAGSSFTYNGFVLRLQGNAVVVPPSHNFTVYFNSFKVQGPPLNLQALASVNNIVTPANFGLIIGWVTLRDDIYLFTTDGTYDPDDPATWPGGIKPITNGQIWRFHYDKDSDYSSSASYFIGDNLGNVGVPVYSGLLDFTTCRPIANPGMIESRYENPAIQKIYWTDNYNVPRQINVADPNVAALPVEDLNLQPSLTMDLPIIVQVEDSGVLPMGVYQVGYRLKNVNGSETRFSRTSNLIPIIDRPEANATVSTYFPLKNIRDITTKSLRIQVNNLDTDYDTIEFATIYYFDEFSEPEINIVKEAFIPDSGFVEVYITGAETQIPITVDEFTAFTTFIKRAKTLAAKKQTLFLGNLTIGEQEVPFDARAYRFPINSNTTELTVDSISDVFTVTRNPVTNTYQITAVNAAPVTPYAIPEQHDAIQNYDAQAPTATSKFLYQPGTNILGGKGPNVTYEFFTDSITLDTKFDDSPTGGAYGPHMTPDVNAAITFNSIDRNYVALGSSLSNNNSPYVYDLYVGYKRDEMYRFGIVFFDELDNPTYVNWIADIRMPHIFMPTGTAGGSGAGGPREKVGYGLSTSFSSDITFWDSAVNDLYGKPLGVKFTIDFSTVADKYKKAMIVRVPLKSTDKHILGQGIFRPTYKTRGLITDDSRVFINNPYRGNYAYGAYNDAWYDCWAMDSPEFMFNDFTTLGNDSVDVLGLLFKTDFAHLATQTLGTNNNYFKADRVEWKSGERRLLTGLRLKNYQLLEGATTPSSIKNGVSNNPYRVLLAKSLPIGGASGDFPTGITTLGASSGGFTTTRSVYNCTPRELGTANMRVVNGNNPGSSYNGKSLFIQLTESPARNWNSAAFGGGNFLNLDSWNIQLANEFYFYLANYTRSVPSPFGGLGYFARSNNEYIRCNNLLDISNKTLPVITKVYGGDTAITVMNHIIQFPDRNFASRFSTNNDVDIFLSSVYYPVETSVAVDFRRSVNNTPNIDHNSGVINRVNNLSCAYDINSPSWTTQIEVSENFDLDRVFNYTDKTVYRYFPKPALNRTPTEFDCRTWRSEKKIDGETTDSWSVFKPSSFLDVEAAYGPLNNLVVFQDKLYFIQERGFGVLQVNEQKLISDQASNADLILGSSGILERYDYISTKTGTKHQFSMSVSDYSMIWFDTLARKIYRYKPGALEPLTDIKGYSGYLYDRTGNTLQTFDNPYYMNTTPGLLIWEGRGVHSTYDYRHNEFYMTFLNPDMQTEFTLVYNDLFDGFVGRYGHMPKVYINDKVNIFSPWLDPLAPNMFETIYVHNYGDYGRFYNSPLPQYSYLAFVVNSNPTLEKTFTNLEVVAEAFKENTLKPAFDPEQYDSLAEIDYLDFFEQMRVYDNYQNTDWLYLNDPLQNDPLARRHKTIWNIKVPSDRVVTVNSNIFDPLNLDVLRPRLTRRLKDKWFVVEMKYNNNPNNKIVAHTAKAIYSANSR
jgi:hypothetical protein